MYTQLLNLYTLKQHLQHPQRGHMSLFITPNGKIFDCRQCGVIDHIKFTIDFYNNYREMVLTHKDIDLNTEVSEFILDDETFTLTDIRDFYLDQFDYLQYEDIELYHLIKSNYLAIDNLLVHDVGFVKVSINRGELPVLDLPMPIFNGKKITLEQYKVLLTVLEYNTISYQNFDAKRLIRFREKEFQKTEIKLTDLMNTCKTK
ncbi:MAG: hypothetical protein J6Q15_03260 [Clostridia bacterium]|nr:hypothetical protein [Clostridia bacterium]